MCVCSTVGYLWYCSGWSEQEKTEVSVEVSFRSPVCWLKKTDELGSKQTASRWGCEYVRVNRCRWVGRLLKQPNTRVSQQTAVLHTCSWKLTCGLSHLPLFRSHLVKLEAVDRTAGVLMITFSRCPVTPYPLTFPSEENSQWTAAVPSQTPFPPACCPPDMLKSRACSCERSGGCVTFIAFFPMNFNIHSFGLRHYLEETAFSLWHVLKCICALLPIYFYLIPFYCSAFKIFHVPCKEAHTTMGQHMLRINSSE